jgi:hypothetical protein
MRIKEMERGIKTQERKQVVNAMRVTQASSGSFREEASSIEDHV